MKPVDIKQYFESQVADHDRWHKRNSFYYETLERWFRSVVPSNRSVLELGCADGSLCAGLKPSRAAGIDFTSELITKAKVRHPEGKWINGDLTSGPLLATETYDYVIGADILGYVGDIQAFLENIRPVFNDRSRLALTKLNPFWNVPMRIAAWLGLAQPRAYTSWLNQAQVVQLLDLAGFEIIRKGKFCLMPVRIPILSKLINRWIAPLPLIRRLCAVEYFIAKLKPSPAVTAPSLSVIIPARNEAGNIRSALTRMPGFPGKLEVIFVEGNSTDNTWQTIQEVAAEPWPFEVRVMKQVGKGKGDAVRKGFAEAKGDLLMILDADLTVLPEDLPRFYRVLADRSADYVQGTRLIYPMESGAMRPLNWVGNKFFSFLFSALLGQRFSDTLCGTKCLWKKDYEALAANRTYFGEFDPFGDFDLIFGSAKLNFKIKEIPVHYKERIYGSTNINRFRDGLLLLRMSWFAAKKLYFV